MLVENGQRMSLQALTRALGTKRAAARKALVLEHTRVRDEEAQNEQYGVAVEEHHARSAREFAKRLTAIRACEARQRDDDAAAASGADGGGAPADGAPKRRGRRTRASKPDSFVTDGLESVKVPGTTTAAATTAAAATTRSPADEMGERAVDAQLDGDIDEAAALYEAAIDLEPMHRRNLCNCALFAWKIKADPDRAAALFKAAVFDTGGDDERCV